MRKSISVTLRDLRRGGEGGGAGGEQAASFSASSLSTFGNATVKKPPS